MKKASEEKADQAIEKRLRKLADKEKPKDPPKRRFWPFGSRKNEAPENKLRSSDSEETK